MATNEPIMAGVAGRYASALFELATGKNAVGEVENDLNNFQTLLNESADLRGVLSSPVLSSEQQSKAVGALLTKIEAGDLTKNFFKLLTRNRRLSQAAGVVRAFKGLAAQARGEVTAEVTTATALNEEQTAALKATLKESVGKDVQLMTKVDPSLLGGLIVKIGSRMVDSSLRTKLSSMKATLSGSSI